MIFKKNKTFVFLFLLFPLSLILNIYSKIPSKIILSENSSYSLSISSMCKIKEEPHLRSVFNNQNGFVTKKENTLEFDTSSTGNYNFSVSLFGKIPLKTVSVTVTPENYVIPSGETLGIKIYTDGLLVVSMAEFSDEEGKLVCPAKEAGLKEGDRIVLLNGEEVKTTEQFAQIIKKSQNAELCLIRGEEKIVTTISPKISADEKSMKIGAWVRDSTAGIGTMTFYDPKTKEFGALGHAVCDSDTGDIMQVRAGSILSCEILSISKGKAGEPGELVGRFGDKTYGKIELNSNLGIFGKIKDDYSLESSKAYKTATRNEIKIGKASILSNVDGKGVREYSAEILKISKSSKVDNKGLIIKITDPELIEKTGGIVQGMSGSPILQDGKIIGAVTHVFVNDPTRGYGIFIENMLVK